MTALKPEDCDVLMHLAITTRNLEAAVALYEPDGSFISASGEPVVGHDAIRELMRPMMEVEDFEFTRQPVAFLSAKGDLALLRGTWSATSKDEQGNPVVIGGNNVEIVRRQPDGSWRFVIDHPTGAD